MSRKLAMADIETTAIEYDKGGCMKIPPKVHMLVVEDYHTGKIDAFVGHDEIKNKGIPYLEETDTVVFHNGIGFDLPVLEHHFGLKRRDDWHFIDSLVLCQLFYSNVKEEEDFKRFEAHKKRPDTDPFKFTGDLIGKHGLEAWGLRLVNPKKKGEYATIAKNNGIDPWAEYNKFMHEYAVQDVVTLSAIWKERLDARFHDKKNQQAIAIEHYMAELMEQVKRSGIKVDRAHAEKLCAELEAERDKVLEVIQAEFPPRLEPKKWVYHEIPWGMPALSEEAEIEYKAKCRSSDPEHIARVNQLLSEAGPKQEFTMLMYEHPDNNIYRPRRNLPGNYLREWWGEVSVPKNNRKVTSRKTGEILYHTSKGDPFVKVEMTPFNPASRPQIARRLMEFGWVPEEFTDTGNPSVSEVELNKIDEQFPAAKSIVKFLLIQKRLGQIKTGEKAWLNLLDDDDFIHPTIRACNTVAFRATHSDPNISQVPSVKTKDVVDEHGNKVKDENGKGIQRVLKGEEGKWGWDCRACFTVPEGFVMVGSDLAGIEMRAWAHYLAPFDNGYFADVVLNKDVHEENRVILGFDDRRKAKEWLYACVPMDTTALTRRGWKTYDELEVGEDILTYNPDTKVQEWQPLLEKVYYDDAPIMELSHTKGFSVRCTPNHRWFTRRRTGASGARYYVDEVVTAEELTSEHAIIQNAPLAESARDGAAMALDYEKYGTEWDKAILAASSVSRSAALLGFLLADGYHEQDGSWAWSQLRGDIAEGMLLASYLEWDNAVRVTPLQHAKNPMMRVRHSKKNFVTGQRLVKKDTGNAAVWCPRTKNGSWVMRQGDTITITGNTMYGAGDLKLGFIIDPLASIDKQKRLGAESRARFMRGMLGYEQLNDQLMLGVRRGWLKGLDGRRIPVRKSHAALNALLQGAGAIISKYWIVFVLDILENRLGLKMGYENDFVLLIYSHDELDFACRAGLENVVADACREAALKAGEHLDFRMPVDVGIMIGKHWGECH